jgi:DNA-binding GntR family transcriptional regulator
MVKDNLAGILREAIISGSLQPGEAIVEGRWALKLKVAQASIREALNILIAEGFVQKEPGRSATVTTLNDSDLLNIYEVRARLESLAGRLVAERKPDLSDLDQVIADMRAAADCNNAEAFYRRDLSFHLLVCQKSGNPVLEQSVRRIVGPLFAFVVMRIHAKRRDLEELRESVEQHRQMLEVLRTGDPDMAERHFSASIRRFLIDTQSMVSGNKRTATASE